MTINPFCTNVPIHFNVSANVAEYWNIDTKWVQTWRLSDSLSDTHTHTHTQTHTQRNCSEMTDNVLKKSHFTVKVINSVTHHDT